MLSKEALRSALSRRQIERTAAEGFRPCAVLVPVVADGGKPRLLFMERAAHPLDPHSGQISFPGGRCEAHDAGAAQTATRELAEELGVPAESVEILGELEQTLVPSGYCITPVVGWIERLPELKPDAREVASTFEVPLTEFAEPGRRFPRGENTLAGRRLEVFEYRASGRVIWGATARIVADLLATVASSRR